MELQQVPRFKSHLLLRGSNPVPATRQGSLHDAAEGTKKGAQGPFFFEPKECPLHGTLILSGMSVNNFESPLDSSFILVRPPRSESGFSLIELVIVVLLVAIVSAVAYSRLSTGTMIVSTQADRLASAIRYAQTLAMTQGARYEVVLTSTTYAVYRTAAGVATLVAEAGSGQVGPYTYDSGVTVTVPPTNLPNSLVTFDGRGIPYTDATSPGTILSPSAAVIQISKEGDTRSIVITPETGSVAVQ